MAEVFDLSQYPIHLGREATASREPFYTGAMEWYQEYSERHDGDGVEGRLVSLYTFHGSWTSWEMHPHGHEVVVLVSGTMTMVQETEAGVERIEMKAGEAIINEPGVWHTAEVKGTATALFITAGMGTEHRPRNASSLPPLP